MDQARSRGRAPACVALALIILVFAQTLSADRASAFSDHRLRAHMLALTNDDRTERDRAALELNATLSRYAAHHSSQMAARGSLFHTADLTSKLKGLNWSIGGENVGVGTSLDDVERAFMDSQPHRKNILRTAFDHAAVGVFGANGRFWVTVIFYG